MTDRASEDRSSADNSLDADGSARLGWTVSRRGLLGATAGAVGLSSPAIAGGAGPTAPGASPTLHVRIYPGAIPLYARLLYGGPDLAGGWTAIHEAASEAVEDALGQISDYAATETTLGELDVVVERRERIGSGLSVSSPLDALTPAATVFDRFRAAVHDRGLVTGRCCHLLLWWDPLNIDLGYGRVRSANSHVTRQADEGSQAIANVGATELWDDRSVTRNIAIHEVLHSLLSNDVVESVNDSRCDHDLGSVVAVDEGVREVSPMATAYEGAGRSGGTRFSGTGCANHDSFSRHDGTADVDEWRYTTTLSDATKEAVTTYVAERLR